MLIAGIIGSEGKLQTANLINSILASTGKKVSVIDSKNLLGYEIKRIKAYLSELEKNNSDILLLKINKEDIDFFLMNEMHFDILIYTDKAEEIPNFSLIAERGIAIVNIDDTNLISLLHGMKQHVVTYGFNTKASITTSSVGDNLLKDGFICCLQRTISARNGARIEPQEYKLNLESTEFDTHNVLAAASFAIVNGIDLNHVNGVQPE